MFQRKTQLRMAVTPVCWVYGALKLHTLPHKWVQSLYVNLKRRGECKIALCSCDSHCFRAKVEVKSTETYSGSHECESHGPEVRSTVIPVLFFITFWWFIRGCACMHVDIREQLGGVGSLFCHVNPGDEAQVISLGGKHLFQLSHLTHLYFHSYTMYWFIKWRSFD